MIEIVIPACNNESTIETCLASLQTQTESGWRAWVVDDASTDQTALRVERWQARDNRIRLLRRARRGGPARARNEALRQLEPGHVVFLDADSSAPPDWLTRLLAPLRQGELDIVGGPDVVPPEAPLRSRCIGYSLLDSTLATGGLRRAGNPLGRYIPGTGNLAMAPGVLQHLGRFNEEFADTGEDIEYMLRALQSGFRIGFAADAPVWHHRSPRLRSHYEKMFRYGRRRVDLWRTHGRAAFHWAHAAPAGAIVAFLGLTLVSVGWIAPLLGLVAILLLLDAVGAALRLRDWRCLGVVPCTTLAVPLGYGLGILVRLAECALRWPPRRPRSPS